MFLFKDQLIIRYVLLFSMGACDALIHLSTTKGSINFTASSFVTVEESTLGNDLAIILEVAVQNEDSCKIKCHFKAQCESYNIGPAATNGLQCQLLSVNMYSNATLITHKPRWTHGSIRSEICEKQYCLYDQTCIPNYVNNTAMCVCCQGYYGPRCQAVEPAQQINIVDTIWESTNPESNPTPPFKSAYFSTDGDLSGQQYHQGSCAFMNTVGGTLYWRGKFQSENFVHHIAIYPQDNYFHFLHNVVQVYVGNDGSDPYKNTLCSPMQPAFDGVAVACRNDSAVGLYFFIVREAKPDTKKALSFCEIMAYGMKVTDTVDAQ